MRAIFCIIWLAIGCTSQQHSKNSIHHVVYLSINSTAYDQQESEIMDRLSLLGDIAQVQSFHIGTFTDLQDQRALSDYELVLYMQFADTLAYQQYNQDSTHLAVRKYLAPMLDMPPRTYDYYGVK